MPMVPNFTIFFNFNMFIFKSFFKNITNFAFSYYFYCSFLNNLIFFFKINFFLQSLPLYTSCLFSKLLNDNIVDIQKPDGICCR